MLRSFVICMVWTIAVCSCSKVPHSISYQVQIDPANLTHAVSPIPITMPADSLDAAFADLKWSADVYRFYQLRSGAPYWLKSVKDRSGLVDSLYKLLNRVEYCGLQIGDYHEDELSDADSIRLEALLTDSFLTLAHDINKGKLALMTSGDSIHGHALNGIRTGIELMDYVKSLEPRFIGYHTLKNALGILLDSIDLSSGIRPIVYAQVIRARVNLERWRQLPCQTQNRYVLVNIPAYMLYVIDDDYVIFESKIIVGKPESPTPELAGTIDRIVINPYWYVPRKIAIEDYLPLLQSDSSFIVNNNFEVLDRKGNVLHPDSIRWRDFAPNNFPVMLRQRPGSKNSLGLYKLVFENSLAIYLHDTNAKKLFKRTVRDLSHGCIRVERAEELAHYFLTGSLNVQSKQITKAINNQLPKEIRLSNAVPLYITYFTAADEAGRLVLYDDIYQCDPVNDQ